MNKLAQYGIPRQLSDIKCIVIHNTNNYEMNARQLLNWLKKENTTSQSCHYLVDDKNAVKVMPIDYVAWNTGVAYDYGNLNGIAIEICSNVDKEKYLLAEQRAVNLIKELMKEYHLTTDDIFFHRDFCKDINCPANILSIYGNKKNFLEKYFVKE